MSPSLYLWIGGSPSHPWLCRHLCRRILDDDGTPACGQDHGMLLPPTSGAIGDIFETTPRKGGAGVGRLPVVALLRQEGAEHLEGHRLCAGGGPRHRERRLHHLLPLAPSHRPCLASVPSVSLVVSSPFLPTPRPGTPSVTLSILLRLRTLCLPLLEPFIFPLVTTPR